MSSQDFFNDELLEKRVDTFYGYGNYQGNYWFIGMGEAGGEDFQDIEKRINIWSNRGKCEIDDVAEYHIDMGTWDENIQPTWNKLIRIVLSAKGTGHIYKQDVRKYQKNELARKDKETSLLELLPLPSPSLEHWIYGEHSKLNFLFNRDTYKNYCFEKRINHISQKIKEHQPKAVVFYGIGFKDYWRRITEKITDVEFSETSEGFLICQNTQTVFVIAKHPVAKGLKNEYFHNIGRSIAAKIAEKSLFICVVCGLFKKSVGEARRRHRSFLTLCPLRLCGSLKRAIACKIFSVRSLFSCSVFSAPLRFVKKSDRLQNLHRAIAPFLCVSVVC